TAASSPARTGPGHRRGAAWRWSARAASRSWPRPGRTGSTTRASSSPRRDSAAWPRRASTPRMRAARAWPLALAALTLGALALRLVGLKTGLPYVYNADENNHFVPRAIGMFGHSLDPDYFVNPPAYTYLVHLLFALRWGTSPQRVGAAFAADP